MIQELVILALKVKDEDADAKYECAFVFLYYVMKSYTLLKGVEPLDESGA